MNDYPQPEVLDVSLSRRNLLLFAGVGVAGIAGCSEPTPQEVYPPRPDCADQTVSIESRAVGNEGIDLANALEWDMPGVEKRGANLWLTPLSTAVYNKNTKTYQPIQRFNTRYRIDGDSPFDLAAQFASNGGRFSLSLSTELPLIHDDFVLHAKGMTLTFEDNAVQIETWDGRQQQPTVQAISLPSLAASRRVNVQREADATCLIVGDQIIDLTHISDERLWVGVAAADGPVALTHLALTATTEKPLTLKDMSTLEVAPCADGLQQAASRSKARLGVAVSRTPLFCNERYAALVVGNFGGVGEKKGSITPENALKPQFTQPEEGVFTLQEAKQLVDFAKRHNMTVHGHALIPNRSYPKWMAGLQADTPEQKQRVRDVMVSHIQTLVRAFPEITSWDLFNEPRGWDGWNQTPFFRAMDEDMFEIGLRAALEANPEGKFWINDFALDKAGQTDERRFKTYVDLMERLDRKGLHFAGLGMEGHVYQMPRDNMSTGSDWPTDHIRRRALTLRQFGFKTRIAEMDVVPYIGENNPVTEASLLAQAQQFHDVGKVCAAEGIDFTTWGIGDRWVSTAWLENGEYRYNAHTLWDNQMRQRPAYAALHQAFRQA